MVILDRVLVEAPPVGLDRLADGRRVGGQEQPAEVQVLAADREEVPNGRPVLKVRSRRAGQQVDGSAIGKLGEGSRGEGQPGPGEEMPSLHAGSMPNDRSSGTCRSTIWRGGGAWRSVSRTSKT